MIVSPAEIVRAILVGQGLVIMPAIPGLTLPYIQTPGDGTALCFVNLKEDTIDQALFIHDTAGVWFGRSLRSAKTLLHPGVSMIVRSLNEPQGAALAQSIANALDAVVKSVVMTYDGSQHYLQSLYRVGGINSLGEEVGKRRFLWSLNARVAMQDIEPTLG